MGLVRQAVLAQGIKGRALWWQAAQVQTCATPAPSEGGERR